jgi:hypothetical protein
MYYKIMLLQEIGRGLFYAEEHPMIKTKGSG